ncbi:MAG TPA: DUF488 domain-containing protein [Thermoleophilaceae bacterium]|nr:DUF488 domain-containing protein [Thermoleophilaceae bacterium]
MTAKVLTIGAYGFGADAFFAALDDANVDLFIDLRQRRGLRGSRYAFANSGQLIPELARHGIEYRHIKALAPDSEIRQLQHAADAASGTAKTQRAALSESFVRAYENTKLKPFDWKALAEDLSAYRAPVLFCVERAPEACHRSLVAGRLAGQLGVGVVDLTP